MDQAPDEDLAAFHDTPDDPQAVLGARFEKHRDRLQRMIELRMDPILRQRIGASDVLQDAFVEISARLGDYLADPRMPFFLWIRFITAQKLLGLYRFHAGAKKRDIRRQIANAQGDFPEVTTDALIDRLSATGLTPSDVAVEGELRQQLHRALEEMGDLDREVLVLRHFEALSNIETAAELGIGIDAASKRYIRALERLRSKLASVDDAGSQ